MTYRISRARPCDAHLVRDLNDAIFPGEPIYKLRESAGWLAWCGADPVAFATARDLGDGAVFLSRAGVMPPHRGQGMHTRLIQARVAWARSIGAEVAITYTLSRNIRSACHLEEAGFRLYVPESEWAGEAGTSVLYFRIPLGVRRAA